MSFKLLEPGDYRATLKSVERTGFKNGSGKKLVLKFVTEVEGKEMSVWHDLPVKHNSSKYLEFGRKGADMLLKALGVEEGLEGVDNDINVLEDYEGEELIIGVGIDEGREYVKDGKTLMGKDRNAVKAFKAA